jgi:excisionase family DNA binding protein
MSLYLQHAKMAYTVKEASELLTVSRAQLYRLIDLRELESIKIGKCRRITSHQLDSFLLVQERLNGHAPALGLSRTGGKSHA